MLFRTMILGTGLLLSGVPAGLAADPPVSLELTTDRGFPIDGAQQWSRFLEDRAFGFTHVRIRPARADDVPKIDNRGSESAPRYAVTGVLSSDSRLFLPGLVIRYGRRQDLITWLQKLRRGGRDAVTASTGAFGLTAKQLTTLNDGWKKRVAIATKGKSPREVLQHVQQTSGVTIDLDTAAQQVMSSDNRVFDELKGLSCGTALAAAMRPFGLLVTPTGQGTRTVGVRITKTGKLEDAWPIGTRVRGGVADLAPDLMKFVNVEIVDQPLDDTLDTIQKRLKIPFLYDHNALARHEIDLHDSVSLPRKKTFYKKILDLLLFQKMLVAELRVDEAGAPFLWISSAKH